MPSGTRVNDHRPLLNGKPWSAEYTHWGKFGLLGSATAFRITLTDSEMREVKLLAISGQLKNGKSSLNVESVRSTNRKIDSVATSDP